MRLESRTCSSTKQIPTTEHTTSFASNNILNLKNLSFFYFHPSDVFSDIIDTFLDNALDLQTTCLKTSESDGMIQPMDISPIIEYCDGKMFYSLFLR